FTDQIKPSGPGKYRVLKNDAAAPAVAGLDPGEYLIDGSGKVAYKVEENFPATLKIDPAQAGSPEKLKGPQANTDAGLYRPYHKTDTAGGPAGRYLVNDQGVPIYLADPGINGIHKTRPDGSQVTKYDAPKATLMSYIIKGILNRQLPSRSCKACQSRGSPTLTGRSKIGRRRTIPCSGRLTAICCQ